MKCTITLAITRVLGGTKNHGDTERVTAGAAVAYEAPEEGFEPPTRRLTAAPVPERVATAHSATHGNERSRSASNGPPSVTPTATPVGRLRSALTSFFRSSTPRVEIPFDVLTASPWAF